MEALVVDGGGGAREESEKAKESIEVDESMEGERRPGD